MSCWAPHVEDLGFKEIDPGGVCLQPHAYAWSPLPTSQTTGEAVGALRWLVAHDVYGGCRLHGHQVWVTADDTSSTGPLPLGRGVEAASDVEGPPGLPWPGVVVDVGPPGETKNHWGLTRYPVAK